MAGKPNVPLTDTFDQWRLKTNEVSDNVGDVDTFSPVALGADSLATIISTNVITISQSAHGLTTGSSVIISGVAGPDVNGIPIAEINTTHTVTVLDPDSYTITVATNATSTGIGGGSSMEAQNTNCVDAINRTEANISTNQRGILVKAIALN